MDFIPLVAFIVQQFIRLDGGGIIIFSISIHMYVHYAHLNPLRSSSNSGDAANNKSTRNPLTRQMN